MPTIGTLTVTNYRGQADQMEYAQPGHTISLTDLISFRRQLPVVKNGDRGLLHANVQCKKSFDIGNGVFKDVVFNISGHVPVGVDMTALETYWTNTVLEVVKAPGVKALMKAGDINVND